MRILTTGILSLMMLLLFAGCGGSAEDPEEMDGSTGYEDVNTFIGYNEEKAVGDYMLLTWNCNEGPLVAFADNETDKCGALDADGRIVIPCEYDYIEYMSDDNTYMVEKDGLSGIVDAAGKEILPCEYTTLDSRSAEGDDYVPAQKGEGDPFGFISIKDGKVLIEPKFMSAGSFNGTDLAPVQFDNELWGYIDRKGNTVIEPKFDEAFEFGETTEAGDEKGGEVARVKMAGKDGDRRGKEGIIDTEGNFVIPCKYDWIMDYYHEDGIAIINDSPSDKDDPEYELSDYYGVIDRNGKEIIPLQQDVEIFYSPITDNFCVTKIDENGGEEGSTYYDKNGKKITEEEYEKAQDKFPDTTPAGVEVPEDTETVKRDTSSLDEMKKSGDIYNYIVFCGGLFTQKEKGGLWTMVDEKCNKLMDASFNTEIGRD